MTTFKQFLTEKQMAHSVAETIVFGENEPPIILTPSMMKRLDYTVPNVRAFHITSPDLIPNLMKLEGRKTNQISVLTSLNNAAALEFGIETDGGVVVELKGQIDAYFATDAFTGLLKGGRRSVLIDPDNDFGVSIKRRYADLIGTPEAAEMVVSYIKDLQLKLRKELTEILDRNMTPFFMKQYPEAGIRRNDGYFEAFEKVQTYLIDVEHFQPTDMISMIRPSVGNKDGGKVLQKIVREYLDAQELVMKQNPHLKKLFLMPFNEPTDATSGAYDEAMMSNFKVLGIHVYRQRRTLMPQVEELADNLRSEYDVPVKVHEFVSEVQRYINKKATNFSEILRKKVSS